MLLWHQCAILLLGLTSLQRSLHAATISSAHLPMEARDDSGSQEEDIISTSYVLPNQIFNDGKPYYASKDPISGQLDFNAKKPAGIEPAANEVIDPKEKIVLSNSAPNIHDFLNLPVKYSSSKFVYPLVSSSYANLKYQGSNKNYMTNKKPTSVQATQAAPTSEYNHQYQYTIPTTKLTPVSSPPTTRFTSPSTTSSTTTTTSTTSAATKTNPMTTTSKKPTTITTPSNVRPTHPSIRTSVATSTSILTQSHNKYATVSRKPITAASTTPASKTTTFTTRKKFMPTKKYIPTSSTPTTTLATPIRFPDQPSSGSTLVPSSTQTTQTEPTKPSFNIQSSSNPPSTFELSPQTTQMPTTLKKKPTTPSIPTRSSIYIGSTTNLPGLDPADVYQTLGQKNTLKDNEKKPTMTLSDIFNSLAEEEAAIASQNQGNQGFDEQGNIIQPFSPSWPSPFATHDQQYGGTASTRPIPNSSVASNQQNSQQHQQQTQKPMLSNDQKVISGSQENYSNEYVSYQVQQPNVLQYRPVPGAINNVVISPGQNSASFVLGSQQQVGANAFGTVAKEPLFGKERPVQYGTVINELPPQKPSGVLQQSHPTANQNNAILGNPDQPPAPPSPYQQLPLVGSPNLSSNEGNQQSIQNGISDGSLPLSFPEGHQQQSQGMHQSSNDPNHSDTKELLLQTNIRFPPNEEQPEEQISASIAAGPPETLQVNGHAQPLSLQKIQQTNNVVFPSIKGDDDSVQIQQHEVVTMNQHQQKLSFPESPEQHTPSTHMEPPPPPLQSSDYKPMLNPPKRPHLNRPHGPPTQFAYNEYTRKPIPGITRPNPDRHLPNILPQFRPNAKISNGHTISNFNQEPGNIRIPSGGPPHKRPIHNPGSPQFAHRRQPLMQQPRYPAYRTADSPPGPGPMGMSHSIESNRRTYRLPPYGGQNLQYVDRVYGRPPMPMPMPYPVIRPNTGERHAPLREPEAYKTITSEALELPPERMAAFEEEDLVINDPPQPVTPSKDHKPIDESKLEPVVTLQMLQSQKKPLSLLNDDSGAGEIKVPSELENTEDKMEQVSLQNGLYVVYPMNKKNSDTNDPGSNYKDVTPAIAHVESATHSAYQNTPFSVVRDQPQEPILTVKNKKPQSLQQQTKTQPLKDKFPYPIEKPDPSYSELSVQGRKPSLLVAPRIVHSVYSPGTETPIAVAYTPTESNVYKKYNQKYPDMNMVDSGYGDSQTEDNFSNDFDLRGQNLENNFMAPFYPSISLDTATSAPVNGWSILPSTGSETFEKNQINRADIEEGNSNGEDTGRNSETDHFQPELQGGFKPIYPPDYKIAETVENENENLHQHETNDRPLALPLRMETTPSTILSTSTMTTTTTTSSTTKIPSTTMSSQTSTIHPKLNMSETYTSRPDSKATEIKKPMETSTNAPQTTATPTPRKKSTFVTSLEALLFGEDADLDTEARKQKAKAKIGPRMAGPRSLKLS